MKLDLDTLLAVKTAFQWHSDSSTHCNGYRHLLHMIDEAETADFHICDCVIPKPKTPFMGEIDSNLCRECEGYIKK